MKYKLRGNFPTNPEEALPAILAARGVTDLNNFIYATSACELNPYNLDHIDEAANMLLRHLRNNSDICIIVDADADGFTSSSILWLYIKHIFPQAKLSFTVHEHKQHGLEDKIDWLVDNAVFDLVILPDAGSYDVDEHRRLGEIGCDCLVLDHHSQLYDDNGVPIISNYANTIVVNNQLSPNYGNKSLCGAGVVYKFCEVLDDILGIQQAQNYLDLVALGEIADVMDRTNIETNYIMLEGLSHIQNKGFQTLLAAQSFSLKEKAKFPWPGLTPIDIAFYIAPMINAITRVGTTAEKETMFYCFIEPDRIVPSTKRGAKEGDVETAAEQTARVGGNAKNRQNKIKEKALNLIDFKIQKDQLDKNNIIILELDYEDNIPQEMTGLIAMSIVSKYHKPVMIGRRNNKNEIQGSIRSDTNFNGLPSFKAFLEESNLLEYVAGHDAAAGWGIKANKLTSLIEYANSHLRAEDFINCYAVDYVLDGRKNNCALLYALAEHPEFFGNHIEEIKLIITNISLANIITMGTNKDSIKINYNNVDYIKFKDTDFIEDIFNNRQKTLTIYGRANLNTFNNITTIQCFIDDYEFESDIKNDEYTFF